MSAVFDRSKGSWPHHSSPELVDVHLACGKCAAPFAAAKLFKPMPAAASIWEYPDGYTCQMCECVCVPKFRAVNKKLRVKWMKVKTKGSA